MDAGELGTTERDQKTRAPPRASGAVTTGYRVRLYVFSQGCEYVSAKGRRSRPLWTPPAPLRAAWGKLHIPQTPRRFQRDDGEAAHPPSDPQPMGRSPLFLDLPALPAGREEGLSTLSLMRIWIA